MQLIIILHFYRTMTREDAAIIQQNHSVTSPQTPTQHPQQQQQQQQINNCNNGLQQQNINSNMGINSHQQQAGNGVINHQRDSMGGGTGSLQRSQSPTPMTHHRTSR